MWRKLTNRQSVDEDSRTIWRPRAGSLVPSDLVDRRLQPRPARREWASEKIMGSYLARGHPLSPAPRGRGPGDPGPNVQITFRWVDDGKLVADK